MTSAAANDDDATTAKETSAMVQNDPSASIVDDPPGVDLPLTSQNGHETDDVTIAALYDGVTLAVDEVPPSHQGQHPALSALCVVDATSVSAGETPQQIVPNTPMPFPLNNECFTGHVTLLVRTPDVDEALHHHHHNHGDTKGDGVTTSQLRMDDTPRRVSEYFSDKKRRFEFQFQIRLKKVPTGPLFLGCELEHSIQVGAITKGLVGVMLAMVRRINPGFHYSWGTQQQSSKAVLAAGNYEKTHLSFPVEASMDRIVITKSGEEPPALGSELYESPESIKRRRKTGAGSVPWNTTDTFTTCLWSAYCDWIQWRSLNVPGVSPFSLCRVTGRQPIYLCVYELPGISAQEYRKKRPPHKRCDLKVYARLEFSHAEKTVGGFGPEVVAKDDSLLENDVACCIDGRTKEKSMQSRRSLRIAASTIGRGVVSGSDDGFRDDSQSVCSDSVEKYSHVTMSS